MRIGLAQGDDAWCQTVRRSALAVTQKRQDILNFTLWQPPRDDHSC